MNNVRSRYAPSPTGQLHIGNARTALYAYLFVKKNNGKLIFRTENTDINRNVHNAEECQISNLSWLGINFDESPNNEGNFGPYRQLERLDIYKKYVQYLLDNNYAYKCYCTTTELEKSRIEQRNENKSPKYNRKCLNLNLQQLNQYEKEKKPYSVRLKSFENKTLQWNDLIRKEITFNSNEIEDWIIVKSDGIPTYNFCCAIDDHLMQITHVLRGEEHISNTPKQLMIYKIFGWKQPKFAHLSVIVNENGKKLSKRDENVIQFIEQYKCLGYLPKALFNFISLLGFAPSNEEEILTEEQLIKEFDINRLSSAPAFFDIKKLNWINSIYIKKLDEDEYYNFVKQYIKNYKSYDQQWLKQVALLYKDQIKFATEINTYANILINKHISLTCDIHEYFTNNKYGIIVLKEFLKKIKEYRKVDVDNVKQILKALQCNLECKTKELLMPLRVATTGEFKGPSLIKIISLLGKENTISNIEAVLKYI